jgi:hypothetical protein
MNVIFGKDNLDQIDDRYTALELETIHYKDGTYSPSHKLRNRRPR